MVAALRTSLDEGSAFAKLLEPDLLVDGAEPEQRVVYSGISWNRYAAIDKERGDDRSVPRFYYLDGELEIMGTSDEHERLAESIGGLLEILFEETGIEITPRGHATMRDAMKKAGAEPDKSWCLRESKKFPDLVLEVALTSGGVDKLEIYTRFKVPEVWIWRRNKLEIFALEQSGNYRKLQKSRLLPRLDIALLERCVTLASWQEARRTFRAALSRKRRTSRS